MATYASSLIEALRTPMETGTASGVSLLANPVSPAMPAATPRARPMSYLQATTPLTYTPGVDFVNRPVVSGGSGGGVTGADLGYMDSVSALPQYVPPVVSAPAPQDTFTGTSTGTLADPQGTALTSPVEDQGEVVTRELPGLRNDILNAINLQEQVPVMEQIKRPIIETTMTTSEGDVVGRTTTQNEPQQQSLAPIPVPTFENEPLITDDEVTQLINESAGAVANFPSVQDVQTGTLQAGDLEPGPLVTDEEVEQLIQDNLDLLIPGGNWKAYQQLNKGAPGDGIPLDEEEELLKMLGRGEF